MFKEVATATGGNLSDMARRLGCSRSVIYNWVRDDEKFSDIMEDVRESMIDLAESQLIKLIEGVPIYAKVDDEETGQKSERLTGWQVRPDSTLLIFFLKTKGKSRGYDQNEKVPEKPAGPTEHRLTVYDPATGVVVDLTNIGAAIEDDY